MKIAIRPAPHSKKCAGSDIGKSCDLYANHSEKCAECEADTDYSMCCEMKHCWQLGLKLKAELEKRGHTVIMANKKYRKGWPESKASSFTKLACAEMWAENPDIHLAIHTNSAGSKSSACQAMFHPMRTNYGGKTRYTESIKLSNCIAEAMKGCYPGPCTTREYNAYETRCAPCPGSYLELGYANSNVTDAEWIHENMDEIARCIANGLEAYGGKVTEQESTVKEPEKVEKETEVETPTSTYTVKKGDTLWKIAIALLGNGNRYEEIMSLNGLKSSVIHKGQVLKIPGEYVAEPEVETEVETYTVKKGDTLWKISEQLLGTGTRYKEIMSLNGLTSSVINKGDVLEIPKK